MYRFAKRIGSAAAVGVAVAATSLLVPGVASAAPPASVVNKPTGPSGPGILSCSHSHPDIDQRNYARLFNGNGVNQRPGPHTNCNPPLGQGQLTHTVDYHCYDVGDAVGGYSTWTYLRNVTTGISGWVSDSLLDQNPNGTRGSLVRC